MPRALKSLNISSAFATQKLLEDVIEGIRFLVVVLIQLIIE